MTMSTSDLASRDREALQLAIDVVLSNPEDPQYEGLRNRLGHVDDEADSKEKDRLWREAAEFASYGYQYDILGLNPSQDPVCVLDDYEQIIQAGPSHRNYQGARIRRKLINYGISVWHPDPVRAIEEAKRKKR